MRVLLYKQAAKTAFLCFGSLAHNNGSSFVCNILNYVRERMLQKISSSSTLYKWDTFPVNSWTFPISIEFESKRVWY